MFHLLVMVAVCAAVALVAGDPTGFVWLVMIEVLSGGRHAEEHHPDTWLARVAAQPFLVMTGGIVATLIVGQVAGFEPRGRDGTIALLGVMASTQVLSYCWHRYQHGRKPRWLAGMAAAVPCIVATALLVRWWSP